MAKIPGLNITAPVVPSQDTDTYPSHRAIYGYGGWREVSTVADRDAIPELRREAGMAVYVTSEKKLYILNSDLVTWSLFSAGGVVVMPTPSETELGNIIQYIGPTTENYTQGYFYKCVSDGADPAVYSWERIDVQPNTAVWGSITGTLSDQTDLNNELTNLQDQIDVLKSRGRYLSTWDTQTGLPGTNPEELPYPLRAGDYYLVSNAVKAMPETLNCGQLVGTGLSDVTINESQWKTIVDPQEDLIQDFSYTNVEITQTQTPSGDTTSLTVLNQVLLDQKFVEIEQITREYCEEHGRTFARFTGISVEWYNEDNGKILIQGHCECVEYPEQDNPVDIERLVATNRETREQELKSLLLSNYGLKINGTMQFPVPWMHHSIFLNVSGPTNRWTYLGQPVENDDLTTAYGISYTGTPVVGDVIEVEYLTEKVNYRPIVEIVVIEGVPTKCYNGTASTEIEPLEVSINDSYVFDGNVWILLSNAQKEVSFSALTGSPYDNISLGEALDSKVEDVRLNDVSVVTNKIANITVDLEVTESSTNLITSGGVFSAISEATPLYTAEEPATVDVGGFNKGDQPENMTFQDFADTLLHKYVDPSISSTISPTGTIYQLGTTKDITMSATITRNAPSKYPFTSLTFYSEGTQKERITDGVNVKTGTWSHTFEGVGTTTKTKYYIENLKATAVDSTGKNVSTTKDIKFVAPTFYGKVAVPRETEEAGQTGQYIQNNIETIISNCTRGLETGNVTYNCNLSVEHYVFITPFTVTEIKDLVTSFQYLASTSNFNYTRTDNGVTTVYKVYYLTSQATGTGYKFQFTVSVAEG